MVTLAVSSQKGGVGKTTVSVNLAHAFASSGKRVLLVDTDPQGSIGLSLTKQSKTLKGIFDLITDSSLSINEIILPTRMKELSIVPAGQAEGYQIEPGDEVVKNKIRLLFESIKNVYDICIVDCAAGVFGLTMDILDTVDAVLIPQQAEPLGVRSIPKILENLQKARQRNPSLKVLGLLLTMTQNEVKEVREVTEGIRSLLPLQLLFNTQIPRDTLFLKASANGVPIAILEEGQSLADIFESLREEIEAKL